MPSVHAISAFQDNYIWAIVHNRQAIIVDPGDAGPVQAFLEQQDLSLAAILITHWHADHIGGLKKLARPGIRIYGPQHEAIRPVTEHVSDGMTFELEGLSFSVLAVPGHTLEHVAYHCQAQHWLFCGDTLFAGGCGRLFEGTPAMMVDSLAKLTALAPETGVYCAHEYTLANLRFALAVEPDNASLKARYQHCRELREQHLPTIPSTIAVELASNPFVRVTEPQVVDSALKHGAASQGAVDVFACLREWKNNF